MRLTIARAMQLFGVIACLGLLSIVGVSTVALEELEVTGPLYTQIANGKDLIGDILPPPEYVIEAYLDANLAAQNPADIARYKAMLADLHRQYDDRHGYWMMADLPAGLRRELTETSDAQVRQFWKQLEGQVIPAVERHDAPATAQAMRVLGRIYEAHRQVIDDIVTKATNFDSANEADATVKLRYYKRAMFGGLGLVMVLVIGGLVMLSRRIVVPIKYLSGYMSSLAGGSLAREVPFQEKADEIGEMARATASFRESIMDRLRARDEREGERVTVEQERQKNTAAREAAVKQLDWVVKCMTEGLDRLMHGEMLFRLTEWFPVEYKKLRMDFNQAMETLQNTMRAVHASTQGVRSGVDEITQASDDLSRRTEKQAVTLEQTAAALDEITATVNKTAEAARAASGIVTVAKSDTEGSDRILRETVAAMSGIEDSSRQIASIIGVIDEIAFQTNLLALNAGVEAARAGDAGRGFAVVATEVRALAQRSADAAKEIKSLISASGQQVGTGVRLVGDTSKALARTLEHVNQIDRIVGEIAASAQEQAQALHEVNAAVNQMDEVTQQNAAMVEQSTAACHALSAEAEELARLIGQFRTDGQADEPDKLVPAAKQAKVADREMSLLH